MASAYCADALAAARTACGEEALRRDSGAGPEAGERIYLIDRTNHLV